jgi:hypothetical protein
VSHELRVKEAVSIRSQGGREIRGEHTRTSRRRKGNPKSSMDSRSSSLQVPRTRDITVMAQSGLKADSRRRKISHTEE